MSRLSMHCWMLWLVAGASLVAAAPDSNSRIGDKENPPDLANLLLGETTSPFPPPKKDDRTFVVNSSPGLDTGCTFRSGGPLVFDIEIGRFLGPTNPDGTLMNALALVNAGLLSPYATIIFPAFDVDFDAVVTPPDMPERDRIFFNGEAVDSLFAGNGPFLLGANNIWRLNSFQIPIEKVRFPSARGSAGNAPQPAKNEMRIDIDTANSGELWCTAIDWAALTIKATSPVILIHGNSSLGAFYTRHGFGQALTTAMLQWDNSISFVPNQTTIAANAAALAVEIPRIVREFGVDSVHVVCHSKGGLDTREYLATHQPRFDDEFKVLSYTSLSTPHDGSVLPDLIVARYTAAVVNAHSKRYVGFPSFTEKLVDKAMLNGGYPDLQTTSCATFNIANLPRLPRGVTYHTVAADLDINGNGKVDSTPPEWQALALDEPELNNHINFISQRAVNVPYQILRKTIAITCVVTSNFLGFRTATFTSIPTPFALGNDVAVSIPSGHGVGGFITKTINVNRATFSGPTGRNHSNVADGGVAARVAPWIIAVEQTKGDLR